MIQTILWDVDGTLLDFDAAERAALRTLFAEFELGFCTEQMLARYSVGRVVCLGGMADNTRIPHMADAHRGKIVEHISRQVGKLATAVFGNRAVLFARKVTIAEKPCQYLINNNFIHQLMINSQ